jgi:hypothetical protein
MGSCRAAQRGVDMRMQRSSNEVRTPPIKSWRGNFIEIRFRALCERPTPPST